MDCACDGESHCVAHRFIHSEDSECRVDPETDLCLDCGVLHAEACPECGNRAFHSPNCTLLGD